MRGTLHLLAADDVRWLLELLGPIFAASTARRRAQLGLDEATTGRGVKALCALLADRGPQTRDELREALAPRGIPVAGQAIVHLIGYAAMTGVLCEGPEQGGKPAYALLDDWLEPGQGLGDGAAPELARRYLAAFGPATPQDFIAWSGLPAAQAREAWRRIGGELIELRLGDEPAWLPRSREAWLAEGDEEPGARLLPAYDTYLMGYRSRALTVPEAHAKQVHPGGGTLRPTVLASGQAVGTWALQRTRGRPDVEVRLFDKLTPAEQAALEAEAADVRRFFSE
jgi:hypothetical protein